MLSLLLIFYREVVTYDPMAQLGPGEETSEGKAVKVDAYKPAWGREIAEKNLFSALRGKVPPPLPAAVEAMPTMVEPARERPEFGLQGIVRNQFGEYVAYVRKGQVVLPLRKGDSFDDTSVVDVQEREVLLLWDGEEIRLSMVKFKTIKR